MNKILRLDVTGRPQAWLSREEAAVLYCKSLVRWEYGSTTTIVFGGIGRDGSRSSISLRAVVATAGVVHGNSTGQSFSNRMLFKRDAYRCMYCGQKFPIAELTRDHVHPRTRGGADTWENVVAACRSCNQRKADRRPEEANMPLLAVPFRPNVFEHMYLAQHTILADQMQYLERKFSGNRTWSHAS
jgi:DNA-directed RNA polymerase subunit RPC12/RpoP